MLVSMGSSRNGSLFPSHSPRAAISLEDGPHLTLSQLLIPGNPAVSKNTSLCAYPHRFSPLSRPEDMQGMVYLCPVQGSRDASARVHE